MPLTSDLGANTSMCWQIIHNLNEPPCLFSFGSGVLWISEDGNRTEFTSSALGRFATDRIQFFKRLNGGTERITTPPERLFRNMLAGPRPPLPELLGIRTVPVFDTTGKLHDRRGYSTATKMYYTPPDGFELPLNPDPALLDVANELLLTDLLGDFPFDGPASQANALAAMVLPFVRPMINGPTPLHLISKPKAGSGASLLADVLARPGLGKPKVITFPQQEDERRRVFLSLLRSDPGAIVLDNVSQLCGPSEVDPIVWTKIWLSLDSGAG